MSIRTKIQLLILFFAGISFYSCVKIQDLSPIPLITFQSFVQYGSDSAVLTINFQDGSGQGIGLNPWDTAAPYKGIYYNDLFMIYYKKGLDGTFTRSYNPRSSDSLEYDYRVPYVTPTVQNKALSGTITVSLYGTSLGGPYWNAGQGGYTLDSVIRFNVYIYDRALHKSNQFTTPNIHIPATWHH
jgi:hypothetical protein